VTCHAYFSATSLFIGFVYGTSSASWTAEWVYLSFLELVTDTWMSGPGIGTGSGV